jgi:ankyrin repeat protein
MSWVCQSCRSSGAKDRPSTFHDEDAYRQHLERDHRSIAANELSLVIQMSCQKESPLYSCCVFCGFIPEAHLRDVESETCQREIISHMAKSHLQPFALNSVPWDVTGGEHADSGRVSDSSATNSNYEDIKQQIMNDPRLGQFEVSVLEAETLRDRNGSVQQTVSQESNVYTASLDEIGRRSSAKDDQGPKDRVSEWCNDQKTMIAHYTLADRDRLLGTEENDTSWASMDKDAPERISQVETPQISNPSPMEGGEIPPGLDRKQSTVPPATDGIFRIVEVSEEDDDTENDATEKHVLTHEEKQFLKLAARGDREGLAEFLSDRAESFNFNCTDSLDRNAVHLVLSYPSLIDDLAKAGCDVDHWAPEFGNPLCLAVSHENADAVEALLRCSTDLEKRFPHQSPALHLACHVQNEGIVRLLLDHNAKTDESIRMVFKKDGALQDTELDGDGVDDVEESVTSHDSLIEVTFASMIDSIRGTPLAISAFLGDVGITKLLLEHGASVEAEAIWRELNDGAEITATPLVIACRAGMSQVVGVLLDAGANIDQENSDGNTPATHAIWAKSLDTLEVLIDHVPCAEDRSPHFAREFRRAARRGQADTVRLFLEKGVEPDASDGEITPLLAASFRGQYDVVTMLLEAGASVHKTDPDGQSVLHIAAIRGHAHVLELLIKWDSKVDLQDNDLCTALMASTRAEDPACMLILLDSGANIDICGDDGTSALSNAASKNRDKHAKLLLERGAHIEATDNDGWTALMYAVSWDHYEVTKLLIDNKANVNHQSGEQLNTPLTVAAYNGSIKAAEMLIDNGALLEAKTQKGNTALFEACEGNKVEVLKLLIDRGCLLDGEDSKGDTVLLKTVNAGHIECLQILIEAGATAGPSHLVWELALLLAAQKGNVACLRLLLLKVSPDVTNREGMTALSVAVLEGHLECARLLLDAKANVDSTSSSGKTALHHATAYNELELTKLLLDRGANHSHRDINGGTPLLVLAAEEDVTDAQDCVAALVEAGASVNDKDDKGKSALWLATHHGDVSVLQALCSYDDLDKDGFDGDGQTALMHAALDEKSPKKTELLIAAGANLELQTPSDGRNALAYALGILNCPAAVALMQAGSDLSMVIPAISSATLLDMKEGLDELMTCHFGEDCLDLTKANLRMVVTQLGVLKQARDPVVALKPHQKKILADWAKAAKQKLRSQRKHKSVTFERTDTPELGAEEAGSRREHKNVTFEPIETPELRAETGSQPVSEYSSGSENGSFSEDDVSHLESMESSSNGASSDQPESAPSTTTSLERVEVD